MINLTMKEANRYKTISEVIEGYLTAKDAAGILKLGERQIYRLKDRIKKEGVKGVIHKGRGKRDPRWLTPKIKSNINRLYKTKYRGFNVVHMTEFLNSDENIKVSRESTRQILIEKGSYKKWKKHPKHRQWREPHPREGQMLQFDTSDHEWLEERGP